MTTAAVTPQPLEMERRRGIELLTFEVNTTISGQILSAKKKPIENKDSHEKKDVLCFVIDERDGAGLDHRTERQFEFPQHADLTTKLLASDVGRIVTVRCTGTKAMTGNRNPMKQFDVDVSKTVYALPEDIAGIITDSDIPF